jgi:uncharacterized membrane protein (DUF4010 family)
VLKLAALIGIVMVLTKLASVTAGVKALFALAALSGIADVDAITLSMARMAGSTITTSQAADAILIAACVNTIVKAAMATGVAGRRMALIVGLPSCAAVAAIAGMRGLGAGLLPLSP